MASWKPDPEVMAVMQALYAAGPPPAPPAIGDIQARRTMVETMFTAFHPPVAADIVTKDYTVTGSDGNKIAGRLYTKKDAPTNSAGILYLHGGGYIAGGEGCGGLGLYAPFIAKYVTATGVPFFQVDYRLAPEAQYPKNVDDAHKGLLFLFEHAEEWGIDPKRIAVMGDSGGGGLAAALVHYNLENNGPQLAKQILIYPMLDSKNVEPDPMLDEMASWKAGDNKTGWQAILGDSFGKAGVKPSAVPAVMTDAKGQPPAFIDCGELDLFRDEDIDYAKKIVQAGISCELHIYPGVIHGFDVFAPHADVSQRAFQNRYQAIRTISPTAESKL